jgi:uncharacterized membrane protein SpoIIM required for sporulation
VSTANSSRAWLATRAPIWRTLAETGERLRLRRRASVDEALRTLDSYRGLARDLATARQQLPGSGITAALESIYAAFHALINRPPHNTRAAIALMFRSEIPAIVRSLRQPLLWVTLLFTLSGAAGWLLISSYPKLISLFASQQMIDQVETGHLWTEDILNITPSSILSVRIFSNNIVVSALALCAGIFYGLGTFYLIALNGLLLGTAFAFTRQYGLDGELLNFILAHGLVELSIICLAGAAGSALGESLIRPVDGNRRESFQLCAARCAKLLVLCTLLLVGCGLIEGFVSPDPEFPFISRLVIGVCYWFVMWAALTGRLYGRMAVPGSAS